MPAKKSSQRSRKENAPPPGRRGGLGGESSVRLFGSSENATSSRDPLPEPSFPKEEGAASTLSRGVLRAIETNAIAPRPAWHFAVIRGAAWVLGIVATILGGLAAGLAIEGSQIRDFAETGKFAPDRPLEILAALPLLWLGMLAVALVLGGSALRQTRRGYRLPLVALALGSVAVSAALGAGFSELGETARLDRGLRETVPMYAEHELMRAGMMGGPEDGILVGEVVELGDDALILRDPSGNFWLAGFADTKVRCPEALREPRPIVLLGEIVGEFTFSAREIHAPGCRGGAFRERNLGGTP